MEELRELSMVLLMLISMLLLASSRIRFCIRLVAIQGFLVGIVPVIASGSLPETGVILTAVSAIAVKCVLLPILLSRSQITADVRREVDPFISYSASIIIGIICLVLCFWMGDKLPVMERNVSPVAVPCAIFTILIGLFLIVSRRIALTQVLGYLVFENGIYLFGGALLLENGFVIELGILLDVFVLVFVMGIAVFHISHEFNHISTDKLSSLSDWIDDDNVSEEAGK